MRFLKLFNITLTIIDVQLFLTCISLPFLISWGIPISIVSWVGTPLFTPFLSLFLGLSSLLFFTQLIGLHLHFLIVSLEFVTQWWLYFLSFGSQNWLLFIPEPPIIITILLPITALFLIASPLFCNKLIRIFAFFAILISYYFFAHWYAQYQAPHYWTVTIGSQPIYFFKGKDNNLIMLDPGTLGSKVRGDSFVEYTLIPEITKKTGSLAIDQIIILQATRQTFHVIEKLSLHTNLKKIYGPKFIVSQEIQLPDFYHDHSKYEAIDVEHSFVINIDKSRKIRLCSHNSLINNPLLRYYPIQAIYTKRKHTQLFDSIVMTKRQKLGRK